MAVVKSVWLANIKNKRKLRQDLAEFTGMSIRQLKDYYIYGKRKDKMVIKLRGIDRNSGKFWRVNNRNRKNKKITLDDMRKLYAKLASKKEKY